MTHSSLIPSLLRGAGAAAAAASGAGNGRFLLEVAQLVDLASGNASSTTPAVVGPSTAPVHAPSAAPTSTDDACASGNCPIVVTLCILYMCVAIQCGYEYTSNKSPVRLISNLQLALATQAVIRAAAIVVIFAVPAESDAVQWRLVVLSDIPGLVYCGVFVLFCTSAMAHMIEGDRSKRCIKMGVFICTCLIMIVWFVAVAFLTGTSTDASTIADVMRMVVIGVLCVLVMGLAAFMWKLTANTARNDVIQ